MNEKKNSLKQNVNLSKETAPSEEHSAYETFVQMDVPADRIADKEEYIDEP